MSRRMPFRSARGVLFARPLAAWTLCAALLAGCGGGGGGGSSVLPSGSTSSGNSGSTQQTQNYVTTPAYIAISVPQGATTSSGARTPRFVSFNTQSLAIAITTVNGATPSPALPLTTADLNVSNPNCTLSGTVLNCSIPVSAPVGVDTFLVKTFSAPAASQSAANQIGVVTTQQAVAQNATNRLTMAVSGIVTSLYVFVVNSAVTSGTSTSTLGVVVPLDATGAVIVNPGTYSPAITVSSSSPTIGFITNLAAGVTPTAALASPTATLNSPSDTLTVFYSGAALTSAATLTAVAGSASGSTTISPITFLQTTLVPGGNAVVSGNSITLDANVVSVGTASARRLIAAANPSPSPSPSAALVSPNHFGVVMSLGNPAGYTVSGCANLLTVNKLAPGAYDISSGSAAGTCVLTFADGATTKTYNITINAQPALSQPTLTLASGSSTNLVASGGTTTSTTQPYFTGSSNPSVATGSFNGATLTVTAVGAGTALVYADDAVGGAAAVFVTVTPNSSQVMQTTLLPIASTSSSTGALFTGTSVALDAGAPTPSPTSVPGSFGVLTTLGNTTGYTVGATACASLLTAAPGATVGLTNFTAKSGLTGLPSTCALTFSDGATSSTVNVTVNAPPSFATTSFTIAGGSQTTTTVAGGTLGAGANPYQVSSQNPNVASATVTGTLVTINALGAGTATLVVQDGVGGRGVATVTVPTAPTPSPSIAPIAAQIIPNGSTIVSGSTAQVDAAPPSPGPTPVFTATQGNVNIAVTGGVAANYQATGCSSLATLQAQSLFGITGFSAIPNAGVSGTCTITVGDGNAAHGTASIALTVNPQPSFANANYALTAGQSTTTTVSGGTNNTSCNYNGFTSNPGVAFVNFNGCNVTITAGFAGTATIVVQDQFGGGGTATVTVTGTALSAGGNSTTGLPFPNTGNTFVRGISGGTAPYTLQSCPTSVVTGAIVSSPIVGLSLTPVATGNGNCIVTDANGTSVTIPVRIMAATVTPSTLVPTLVDQNARTIVFPAPGWPGVATVVLAGMGGSYNVNTTGARISADGVTFATSTLSSSQLAGNTFYVLPPASNGTGNASITITNLVTNGSGGPDNSSITLQVRTLSVTIPVQ